MAIRTVYIAGPMRGYPEYNFPAFMEAEEALHKRGYYVFNPARMDLDEGFNPSGGLQGFSLRRAVIRNVEAIAESDAIVLLPGWEDSVGAQMEVALARLLDMPVLLYPELLVKVFIDKERSEPAKEHVLEEAIRLVLGDRHNTYGPPVEDFGRTARLWSVLKGVPFTASEVALFMIAVKMSRQVHCGKRDNWVDIAGYAQCGSECDEQE